MQFKDDEHTRNFLEVLSNYEIIVPDDYREFSSFLFLLTSIDKHTDFDFIQAGVDFDEELIKNKMKNYSESERNIIRLALQMLDHDSDDITLAEAMNSISDEREREVVLSCINYRYYYKIERK